MASPQAGPPGGTSQIVGMLNIPSDAVVVRGYLGRSDAISKAVALIAPLVDGAQIDGNPVPADCANAVKDHLLASAGETPTELPWRIYLSPDLDCYIEFLETDVIAHQLEDEADREDSYTVWLKPRASSDPYRLVDMQPLTAANRYIRGDLVEDYMQQAGPGSGVWDEQDAYLRAGKPTYTNCQKRR